MNVFIPVVLLALVLSGYTAQPHILTVVLLVGLAHTAVSYSLRVWIFVLLLAGATTAGVYHAPILNMVCLVYICMSLGEWAFHKFVMHCYQHKWLEKLQYLPSPLNYCSLHLAHHKSVKEDMTLHTDSPKSPNYIYQMYLSWNTVLFLPIVLMPTMMAISAYTKVQAPWPVLLATSLTVSLLWTFAWNRTHDMMHEEESKLNIAYGPYDNGLVGMAWLTRMLLRNHHLHHIQKKQQKGHYNIIALGADKWCGTDTEYLILPKPEKVKE